MSLSALKDNFNLTTAYAILVSIALAGAGWYIYQINPTELQHKLDAANAEYLFAKDEAEIAIAKAEIYKKEAEKKLEELDKIFKGLENENKTLESDLYKCRAELEIALKKIDDYETTITDGPLPTLGELTRLQEENLQLKSDLEVAKKDSSKKSAELTAAIEHLNKTVENLNNEIKLKNDEIARLSNPDRSLSDALNNIPGFQNLPVKDQNAYRQDLLKLKSKIQKRIEKK